MSKLRIAWKTSRLNSNVASVRYRCLIPFGYLVNAGHTCYAFQGCDPIDFSKFDAIVFVKTFSEYDFYLAQKAKAYGVKVFLDLCDNILYNVKNGQMPLSYKCFVPMAKLCDGLVCPTEELKSTLKKTLPETNIQVIADPIEPLDSGKYFKNLVRTLEFKKIFHGNKILIPLILILEMFRGCDPRRYTDRLYFFLIWLVGGVVRRVGASAVNLISPFVPKSICFMCDYRLVSEAKSAKEKNMKLIPFEQLKGPVLGWFGNSGAIGVFGMTDLLMLEKDLERLCADFGATLLVISDNPVMLNQFKHLKINVSYKAWGIKTIIDDLKKVDVMLLPNLKNEFSGCKSANRAVLSIQLGKPVVLTSTKSNLFFGETVMRAGDWYEGVKFYITNSEIAKEHVRMANSLMKQELSEERILQAWTDVFENNKKEIHLSAEAVPIVHT